MKTYKIAFLLLSIMLVSGACTNGFEEANTNPNYPEEVVPDYILPNLIYSSVDVGYGGSIVTQQITPISYSVSLGQYDWNSSPYWDYDNLRNVINMYNDAVKENNLNFEGVALVLKSFLFARTSDCVGMIPYRDALNGKNGVYMATYDTQDSVYAGILRDLETANDLLSTSGLPIGGDILYNGDILKWKKFANSLQLRILMRESNATPNAKTKINTIVSNPAKYPIFENNDDMAALTYLPEVPNQYPFYHDAGLSGGEVVMGKPLVDTLLKYNDPRVSVFARPTQNSIDSGTILYAGVPCAIDNSSASSYNGGATFHSSIGSRYSEEPNAEKGIFMSYAELQFILAEAAAKGWITGNAATYYQNGITGSFAYYGLSDSVNAYLQNPSVVYNASKGLTQIGVQKWISFFFNSGYEPFFDYRRTGIPYLDPGSTTGNKNGGKIPTRWRYPNSESSYNNSNYKAAIAVQGADDLNTSIWLTK